MSSATPRAGERVEFAPLRNFDVEDTGIIHDDEIGDDDGAPTQAPERQLLFRALYVQDAGAFPDVTLTAMLILGNLVVGRCAPQPQFIRRND
jgi:hypothetical protein